MKKLLVSLLLLFTVFGFIQQIKADSETTEIYLHYYRFGGDYDAWSVWTWENEPNPGEGVSIDFVEDTTAESFNFGGVVCQINIADNFPGITKMGLIVKKGDWLEKDISSDRFIEIPSTSNNGEVHFYLVEGDVNIGSSLDDPEGPTKNPKFTSAYFKEMNKIVFSATESISENNITVYADGLPINHESVSVTDLNGYVILSDDLDFSKKYTIEANFTSDGSTNDYLVTFDGIYDSEAFETAFAYDGALGTIIEDNQTTFRIWAPVSETVTLNLYNTGSTEADGGSDEPIATHEMISGEKGTFSYTVDSNLHGTYYTYSVTNGGITNEVVDPYAKSVGINGYRGLVVDFSQVNPEGFTYNSRPDTIENYTDAVIYELHVRDLTTSPTWNGTEVNRGKYLGLIESGTTYDGVKTGFDHIVDLGVTHVQLLPFFDYGVVDETKVEDADYNAFNWGYMPLNFNALEGTYSSDPYDGLVRIQEMKEVIMAYSEAGIRINMDVVYNHTGLSADSNFSLIVPGYYYRMNTNGSFSNGSGTGNETASERYMMRKFMIDSTLFWAEEYNISGFRFDLMGLHDTETMNLLAEALHEVDPTIMVYGEPWTGGTTTLAATLKADKQNIDELTGVAAFNDVVRDGIKGTIWRPEEGGWIQGDNSKATEVKYGIIGGIDAPYLSYNAWHMEPVNSINYVACHDNNVLYDKLYMTLEESGDFELIPDFVKQSYGIILTSQGIPFIHAGDEFMRSKPNESGDGFDSNSYESPDAVNMIRWDLKTTEDGLDVYNYIKGLIALRLEHPSFRMTNAEDVLNNLSFLYEEKDGIISYLITNDTSNDAYDNILVIHNANTKNTRLKLPTEGGWVVITNKDSASGEEITSYLGGERISVEENSTYILYQDTSLGDYNPISTILLIAGGSIVVLAGVAVVVLKFRKK